MTRAEFSSHWRHGLIAAAREMAEAGDALTDCGDAFLRATGLPGRPLDRKTRAVLGELARVLPQAAGRDWRFVLRPDAARLADRLREGLSRFEARRALHDALSPALPESVTQGLRRGLDLLAKHRELAGQLSVAYGAGVATLDVEGLKAEWTKAQQSIWSLRGMRLKAVVKALMAASDGSREPDVAADLERLAALRAVTRDIEALAPAVGDAGPVWSGLDTDVQAVQSLLTFQAMLPAALSAAPWSDSGLGPVAEGRCGGAAAGDLQRLHDLRTLEREVDGLDDLRTITGGLGWEIVRIWSTDWWHDHDGALDKVDARLSALLEASRARRAEEVRRLEEAALAAAVAADDTTTVDAAEDVAPPSDDVGQDDQNPKGTGHRPADDLFLGADLMQPSMAYAHNASPAPPPDADSRFREADPNRW